MLIQKSKGFSAFGEQKVKNIAIEYRLQFFPNPGDSYAGDRSVGSLQGKVVI